MEILEIRRKRSRGISPGPFPSVAKFLGSVPMACRPIVNTNDKKSKKLKILSYPADSLKAPSGLKSVYARAFFFFLANQPTKSKPAESSSEIKIGRRSKSPVSGRSSPSG